MRRSQDPPFCPLTIPSPAAAAAALRAATLPPPCSRGWAAGDLEVAILFDCVEVEAVAGSASVGFLPGQLVLRRHDLVEPLRFVGACEEVLFAWGTVGQWFQLGALNLSECQLLQLIVQCCCHAHHLRVIL